MIQLFLVLWVSILGLVSALGPQVKSWEKRPSMDILSSNQNVTNMSMVVLNNTIGHFQLHLTGYDWRYFMIDTSQYYGELVNMALDVVVNIKGTDGPDTDNCAGQIVYATLRSTVPEVQPRSLVGGNGGSGGGDSDSFGDLFFSLMQTNAMCVRRPELGISIKNTERKRVWYLLLQTRGGRASDTTKCWLQVYYEARDKKTFIMHVVSLLVFLFGSTFLGLIYVFTTVSRPNFRHYHWGVSITRINLLIPEYLRWAIIHGILFVYRWCKDRRRLQLQRQRDAQQQRALLSTPATPAATQRQTEVEEEMQTLSNDTNGGNQRTSRSPSPREDGPPATTTETTNAATESPTAMRAVQFPANPTASLVSVISDDDEKDTCRICKEDGSVEPLIKPCQCQGTVQYIHRSCLDRWRVEATTRNPLYTTHCEICQSPFTIRIERRVISKVLILKVVDLVLLILCYYCVCVAVSLATKLSIGEATCGAPYHDVTYKSPFGVFSFVLGFLAYSCLVAVFGWSVHFVYCVYRNEPDVRQSIRQNGVLPAFWTVRRVTSVISLMLWVLATIAGCGYLAKLLAYEISGSFVWDWELALMTGIVVFCLMFVICISCVLLKLLFCRRLNEWLISEGVIQQRDVYVDSDHGGSMTRQDAGSSVGAATLEDQQEGGGNPSSPYTSHDPEEADGEAQRTAPPPADLAMAEANSNEPPHTTTVEVRPSNGNAAAE